MCIRDRQGASLKAARLNGVDLKEANLTGADLSEAKFLAVDVACLLYTSDAADERSSVDLGGRRIIKKKNNYRHRRAGRHKNKLTKQEKLY